MNVWTLALFLSCITLAHADWEGRMRFTLYSENDPSVRHKIEGQIHAKTHFSRLDIIARKPVSIISDFAKRKTWQLDPIKRSAPAQADHPVASLYPPCSTSNVDACYKDAKEVGTEVVQGHPRASLQDI